MRFQILGSSSCGNAALVDTADSTFLIDAGLSGLKIRRILAELGRSIEEVDAVFVTHEHTDHTAGIVGLSKYPHLKFFANPDTAQAIERRLNRRINWQFFQTGDTFCFQDLTVQTFSIPHDAYDPVGYIFQVPGPASEPLRLAWVTDLGHIPPSIRYLVQSVDLLVIESNYDDEMLQQDSRRPWSLKQRIRGRHGHLSNQDTHDFLLSNPHAKWQYVYLVHLSRDCNCPKIVKNLFKPLVDRLKRFQIDVFDPLGGPSPWIDLALKNESPITDNVYKN